MFSALYVIDLVRFREVRLATMTGLFLAHNSYYVNSWQQVTSCEGSTMASPPIPIP